MRKPFRYILYFVFGFMIYQIIDSGATGLTHQDARNTLAIGIVVVFVLMMIIKVIKNKYGGGGEG